MHIIQSYRSRNIPEWIQVCMESVRGWAAKQGAFYHCADDDELLGLLPELFKEKVGQRWPMLNDLGRLKLAKRALDNGAERVVWLDADVLVTAPELMQLPSELDHGYAFGREIWIEESGRVRRGVHNAICVFEPGNPFLDYYIHACERLIHQHTGEYLAPHLLGPKFLKSQAPLVGMQLLDHVAMASPPVVEDILAGGGKRWGVLQRELPAPAAAYNLCHSLLDDAQALAAVKRLLS